MEEGRATAESPARRLHAFGQSPWLDFIDRALLRCGELERMMDLYGIRGVTSNPAILEKAIAGSPDYDDALRALSARGRSAASVFEALVLEDVCEAADLFRPLYEASGGGDGFASLALSPHLADDTEATVGEGLRLWAALARPNVLIEVPATRAGLPAIRRLLGEGVNVNATLLFGLERYREVLEAHLAALEERHGAGRPLGRVVSTASFFLSRIDAHVDPLLDRLAARGAAGGAAAGLRGEVALACAKRAGAILREVVGGARFAALAAAGARPQRLLWASTGPKDPAYDALKYVEPLIGPETVSAMPQETLAAYHDHGEPALRLAEGLAEAERVLAALPALGLEPGALAEALLEEGLRKLREPFEAVLAAIEARGAEAPPAPRPPVAGL